MSDFRALAGRSENGSRVNLLVSYYDVSVGACPDNSHTTTVIPLSISPDNLPWGDAAFSWQRWVHSSNSAMSLEASGSRSGGSFSTSQSLHSNALEAYRLFDPAPACAKIVGWPTSADSRHHVLTKHQAVGATRGMTCGHDCTGRLSDRALIGGVRNLSETT